MRQDSREAVEVVITSEVDLTDQTVEIALPVPRALPVWWSAEWVAASTSTVVGGITTYKRTARIWVGPPDEDDVAEPSVGVLTVGTHHRLARLDDDPGRPVIEAGSFHVSSAGIDATAPTVPPLAWEVELAAVVDDLADTDVEVAALDLALADVEADVAALTPTARADLLGAGLAKFTTTAGATPQYRLNGDRVEMKGRVTITGGAGVIANEVIAILPVGHRPATVRRLIICASTGITVVQMQTNGELWINATSGTMTNFDLDSTLFYV